jgi:hypothetical protein
MFQYMRCFAERSGAKYGRDSAGLEPHIIC